MKLQERIDLLSQLGKYMLSDDQAWIDAKEKASYENGWFIPEFVEKAIHSIARSFLQKNILEKWVAGYHIPADNTDPKKIGVVMAGNIPMVGFHDLLAVFISGHHAIVKTSSKDKVLIPHLVNTMMAWAPEVREHISFAEMLKGCDAYIATGSNNSAGYFDYYFGKYPHIIRRNKTSVAVVTGEETAKELELLADDVFFYFGLGCRNVTKIYVPRDYDFIPLLTAFKKYDWLGENHKYKNNYDYNLALHLLNKKFYMSTPAILLIEEASLFSPISQLNYEFYENAKEVDALLGTSSSLQCVVGKTHTPFGQAQYPDVTDYADGVDTLAFVMNLSE
ncbi:MAG: acyl-CoA reductase [Chitinophagaceae bacterium]